MLMMCGGVAVGLGRKYSTWSTRHLGGECKVAQEKGWRRRKAGALERQRERERDELTDAGWHSQLTRSQ